MEKEIIDFSLPNLHVKTVTLNVVKNSNLRGIHLHKEIELIYVSKGSLRCNVNGNEIILEKDKFLLINKGVLHVLEPQSDYATFSYIQMDIYDATDTLHDETSIFYSFLGQKQCLQYIIEEDGGELSEIAKEIQKEMSEKKLSYEAYIKAAVMKTVAYMTRHGLIIPSEQTKKSPKVMKIFDAIKYITENYTSEITLAQISSVAGVSKYHFCKLFKEITGSSFTEYLNYVRLNFVERDLSCTNKSISEIAFECGFTSIQYFNRVFREYKKCTPSEYRRLISSNT